MTKLDEIVKEVSKESLLYGRKQSQVDFAKKVALEFSKHILEEKSKEPWDDIRNKMTPFNNLIALIDNGQLKGNIEVHDILNKEIAECKKFIEQLKK